MWLVICYKPSSDDYCRGCHMASYSSDLEREFCTTEEQVVSFIAKLNSRKFDCNETNYYYHIYRKGRLEPNEYDEIEDDIVECTDDFHERIEAETKRLIAERELAEKRAEAKEKELDAQKAKQREIEQLKQLKAKYPEVT